LNGELFATSPEGRIFQVQPLAGVGRPLAYRADPALDPAPQPGFLVRIPLQRRTILGVVLEEDPAAALAYPKLKNILQTVYPHPVAPPALMKLTHWMGRYYGAPAEQCWETVIPAPIRKGKGARLETMVAYEARETEPPRELPRGQKQKELLDFLRDQITPLPRPLVLKRLQASAPSLAKLVELGWLREWQEARFREAYPEESSSRLDPVQPPQLTTEQEQTVREIQPRTEKGFGVHLIYGVTGSGKTEIYLRLIETVLQRGGSILFLVPEVMLAPQTVSRLRGRLTHIGMEVVVWHSHLSEGQRADAWMKVASGQARIVVGARSAVFAPLVNLQLIIVDEEHEPAYKQDETPRYHGRDVAVMRAHLEGALCVLGSATPSLESFLNVRKKKYGISLLRERVENRPLPDLRVVDMRREVGKRGEQQLFSEALLDGIRRRLEKGEQTILFLNRRGFSTSLICPSCGHVMECSHCDIPYTYHRTDHTLKCHLCADEQPVPDACPACGERNWKRHGTGTQRVESVLQQLFPNARLGRLDTDAMVRRHTFRDILRHFQEGKLDILIGTQMVAKGLDFPRVTLVGMIDADKSLHLEDFRASERTFQLLVQVSGRAGRDVLPGEVFVQTMTPKAPAIEAARTGAFDSFWTDEMKAREDHGYPPYRHLIRQVFSGRSRDKTEFYAEGFAREAEKHLPTTVEMRGPAPTPLEKIRDHYRFQIWYFTTSVLKTMDKLNQLRADFPLDPSIRETIDVDPQGIG
jgi:primosomal protein N' (replication factor Y)